MAGLDDEPHQRLSLLLLDSAAELMLYRDATDRLGWDRYPDHELAILRRIEAERGSLSPEMSTRKAELQRSVLSKKQRREVERFFGAKLSYLEARGALPSAYARVLRKLHQYRNEAYHQDAVRRGSLRSAVKVYAIVVCELMRILRPSMMSVSGSLPSPLADYFDGPMPPLSLDSQAVVAAALLKRFGVDTKNDIAVILSDHIIERLNDLDDALGFAARYVAGIRHDADWDVEALLHSVQLDRANYRFATPAELRAAQVPVTLHVLAECREAAAALTSIDEDIEAFSTFADIEDRFDRAEQHVIGMAFAIDEAIQNEVDRLLGK
jgi:hypothetical protein